MAYEKIDVKAAKWLTENGHTLSPELVTKLLDELESYEEYFKNLERNGCGYVECGMAVSGFSNDEPTMVCYKCGLEVCEC